MLFDDSLDLVDFCPSNNIAVMYITEAELVAGCAYRRRLVRLRKVTVLSRSLGLERYWYWVIGYWAIFADIG